jgi:outer membrane protein assembly factor BamB
MHKLVKYPSNRTVLHPPIRPYPNATGNVLIYVVVLMLIFGVLGVVMVSLFTSTTASTVTRNDSRRARYLSEAGVRYAASEMRKADFEEDIIIDPLNTITYTVSGAGSFDLNIFSPWFYSDADVDAPSIINVSPRLGEIPVDFTTDPANPLSAVWLVNYEYITGTGPDILTMRDPAYSYAISGASLAVDIAGSSFLAEAGERVVLAVEPIGPDQDITEGGDLYVARDARFFFPPFNGAININRVDYAYARLVDEEANGWVKLENVTASQFPNTLSAFPSPILSRGSGSGNYDGDFVILSPRNYMVMAEGTSGEVSYGNSYRQGMGFYDHSLIQPGTRKPDITAEKLVSNLSEQESDTRFFETNLVDYELKIGGGTTDEFGSAFFDADMNIGGERNYCQQGACLFASGVRVFFLLDFNQQGDGITFTLLSKGFGALGPPNNSASSVGGDFQLSETMGYAGDSRLDADGNIFLASNVDDRGLDPPKIAIEFDTRTNNTAGDPPPDYCADANTVNTDSRNDPLTGNKDAVQYVFWGRTSSLNIRCRDFNPLYDDNRHDAYGEEPAEQWRFATGGTASFWRPAIGSDGTIYMSARDATLYALNQDGTEKWTFPLGDNNEYMPGIDTKGTSDPSDDVIYSDIVGNKIIAVDWEGNLLWQFDVASDIDSTPIVGPDGRVYFGTDAQQSLFALNPAARLADPTGAGGLNALEGEWQRPTLGQVDGVAALSPDASVVYFVADDPDNNLYAVNTADGSVLWKFSLLADLGEINSSPTVNPSDGTIYVGSDNHNVYGINPDGTEKWRYTTGADVESSPVVAADPSDGNNLTVYIGSDDDKVYAFNAATGAKKWEFLTGGPNVVSSPIVDLDGTVYVGSEDGNVYALKPAARLADPTGAGGLNTLEGEWAFATGGQVRSSPAIGGDGFVFIGSDDTNFYTISQYGDPRNFKDEDKSLGKLLTFEDLDSSVQVDSNTDWLNGASSKGSWAVRMEVECLLRDVNEECTSNADGDYEYELRLWIRQCPDQNDFPCSNILGTFYQDTRIEYDYTAVKDLPMRQRIKLNATEQAAFERFFFGFTGAAGAEALDATVSQFQLSFIRPGDPVVDCDNDAALWPWEDSDPVYNCTPGF